MRITPTGVLHISRCNSVWLECLLWEQDAAGSSPVTSTIYCSYPFGCGQFLFIQKPQNSCIFNTFRDIQISIKDFENAPKLTPNKNIAPKMHTNKDYVYSLLKRKSSSFCFYERAVSILDI